MQLLLLDCMSIGILSWSLHYFWRLFRLRRQGERTIGQFVNYRLNDTDTNVFSPVVRYCTRVGEVKHERIAVFWGVWIYLVGRQVPILYDPQRPEKYSILSLYYIVSYLLLLFLGILLACIGVFATLAR